MLRGLGGRPAGLVEEGRLGRESKEDLLWTPAPEANTEGQNTLAYILYFSLIEISRHLFEKVYFCSKINLWLMLRIIHLQMNLMSSSSTCSVSW